MNHCHQRSPQQPIQKPDVFGRRPARTAGCFGDAIPCSCAQGGMGRRLWRLSSRLGQWDDVNGYGLDFFGEKSKSANLIHSYFDYLLIYSYVDHVSPILAVNWYVFLEPYQLAAQLLFATMSLTPRITANWPSMRDDWLVVSMVDYSEG